MRVSASAGVLVAALVLAACPAEGDVWTATSELAADQEPDCASAPHLASVELEGSSAIVTIEFPPNYEDKVFTDVRTTTWKVDGDGLVTLGSTLTWSEWTLTGGVFESSEDGALRGRVTWEGWYTCNQSVVLVSNE